MQELSRRGTPGPEESTEGLKNGDEDVKGMKGVHRLIERMLGIKRCRMCGKGIYGEDVHRIAGTRGFCTHCWALWVMTKNAFPQLDDETVYGMLNNNRSIGWSKEGKRGLGAFEGSRKYRRK